jgi:hypothetical protein
MCRSMAVYLIHDKSATRANRLQAQIYNVQTLVAMRVEARAYSAQIRTGQLARLRRARLNLAYALLRDDRRMDALWAILPSIVESPGLDAIRAVASIVKGCFGRTKGG